MGKDCPSGMIVTKASKIAPAMPTMKFMSQKALTLGLGTAKISKKHIRGR